MTPPPIIHSQEHEAAFCPISNEYREYLKKRIDSCEQRELLGLHETKGGFAPGNFIGMVWLDKGDKPMVLRVDSKFSTMDYIAMYVKCMAHPTISDRTAKCLHVWSDEELIGTDGHDFSILIVIAYLRELNKFCQQHMRRHFTRERQNFVGKVKGKILVGENLRRNIIHARPDRVYCEYQSVSDDILENQILRTALERASRFFNEYRGDKDVLDILPQWICTSRTALNGVSTRKVKPSDFASARKHGTFAFYKHPLALAKLILQQFGPNPKTEISQAQTPPFVLNSAALFEHYAEIVLSKRFSKLVAPRKNIGNDGNFNVKIRPDFYITDKTEPQIIDAKYKNIDLASKEINNNNQQTKPPHGDIYQVVAYSQHHELLDRMECERDSIQLGLAYPSVSGSDKIIDDKRLQGFFHDIIIYEIPCPIKNNEKK